MDIIILNISFLGVVIAASVAGKAEFTIFKVLERMMERHYELIIKKVLIVITLILIAIAILGCNDPLVTNMEAEHQRLNSVAKQEFQRCGPAFKPISQTDALFPAP
jgi:hypothetical protein